MPEITRRIEYYSRGRGPAVRTLHIETEGAVVNITVGLTDSHGQAVTRVDVVPDDERRGGDGNGRMWFQDDARIVRRPVCEHCGAHLAWSDGYQSWCDHGRANSPACPGETGVHSPQHD